MSLESDYFKRHAVNFKKLEEYGFVKLELNYRFSKIFMTNFRADLCVDEKSNFHGVVFDLDQEEEYDAFRIETVVGDFVSRVREEYLNILADIRSRCFEKLCFTGDQTNRIVNFISDTYHDKPVFPWEKFDSNGVFKNPKNNKWYALVMNIDKGKIVENCSGEVEVINLKLDSKLIPSLLKKKGFYPAYHMNKKNWVTVILDDTLTDQEVIEHIISSHKFTESPHEWLVPANPKFFDIVTFFSQEDTVIWKHSGVIKKGDIVYLYVAKPFSKILYKCIATEVNIKYDYTDKNITMNRIMRLRRLTTYDRDPIDFEILKTHGITTVRGPRRMPMSLSAEIEDLYNKYKD